MDLSTSVPSPLVFHSDLQDFDIYLLDDPLAAVDTKVARHIFDRCIMGVMSEKARILCTHHISYLWDADRIIVVEDGMITQCGKLVFEHWLVMY